MHDIILLAVGYTVGVVIERYLVGRFFPKA